VRKINNNKINCQILINFFLDNLLLKIIVCQLYKNENMVFLDKLVFDVIKQDESLLAIKEWSIYIYKKTIFKINRTIHSSLVFVISRLKGRKAFNSMK